MRHNFIVLRLCDNDYQLLEGLQALLADWDVEHLLKAGPQVVKECVIDMVVARMDVSDRIRGYKGTNERSRDYLGRKLRVTFDQQAPTEDHDHGSCALNVHTKQLWRF